MQRELWIPRTSWEKRRQLSAAIFRAMVSNRRALILSCDDWTTFFKRIDMDSERSSYALETHQLEYIQIPPLFGSPENRGADLSRVLGQVNLKYRDQVIQDVIVDDIDLMVDLGTKEAADASIFALLYALQSRFQNVILFSNPLQNETKIGHLIKMKDVLDIHHTAQPTAA